MLDKPAALNNIIAGDIKKVKQNSLTSTSTSLSSKLSKNGNKKSYNREKAQVATKVAGSANATNATNGNNSTKAIYNLVETDDTENKIDEYGASTEQQLLNILKAVEVQSSNLIELQLEYMGKIHQKFSANQNIDGKLDILFQKQLNALNECQQLNDNYTKLMGEYVNKKLNRINRHIAHFKENIERFSEFQQHAFTTICIQRSELARMRFALGMAMSNKLTLYLPTYDGWENFPTFRIQFGAIVAHNRWNDSEKAVALTAVLRGRLADIYARLPASERKFFSSMINALRAAA